jgi:hypothetical protein
MVLVGGEVVAVLGEHRAALVGDHLKPKTRQFEIAHDLGPEQAADIGAVRIEEPGGQGAAHGRAADPIVLLDDEHIQAGALKITGGDQAIMACPDHHCVPNLHVPIPPPDAKLAQCDIGAAPMSRF